MTFWCWWLSLHALPETLIVKETLRLREAEEKGRGNCGGMRMESGTWLETFTSSKARHPTLINNCLRLLFLPSYEPAVL